MWRDALHLRLSHFGLKCVLMTFHQYQHYLYEKRIDDRKKQDMREQRRMDAWDFSIWFEPDYEFRSSINTDLDAIRAFLRQEMRLAEPSLPKNNDELKRILVDAVNAGDLVAIIEKSALGVTYAFQPISPDAFIEPPVPYPGVARSAPPPVSESGFFGRLGAVASGVVSSARVPSSLLDDLPDLPDDSASADLLGDTDAASGTLSDVASSTPPGDAQPFEYGGGNLDDLGDAIDIAARGVSEADEAECFAQYEAELEECNFYSAMTKDSYTFVACKAQAFLRYNQCRGY